MCMNVLNNRGLNCDIRYSEDELWRMYLLYIAVCGGTSRGSTTDIVRLCGCVIKASRPHTHTHRQTDEEREKERESVCGRPHKVIRTCQSEIELATRRGDPLTAALP